MFIVHFNWIFDVAVGIVNSERTSQSKSEHAIQRIDSPPNLATSFLFDRSDHKSAGRALMAE
jgi:hypothetical protein